MTVSVFPRAALPRTARRGGAPGDAVIEADFLVLGSSDKPAASSSGRKQITGRADTRSLAVLKPERPAPAPLFSRRGSWGFWLGGMFLVAVSFWVSGGHAWLLPQGAKAGPRNTADLSLALLGSGTESARGQPVLHVEAEARNADARARALPAVAILITTGRGVVLRYQVAPPSEGIGPSGRQRFSTRLPVPADGVRSVSVAFAP